MQKYCNKNATIHFKQIMAASKARQPAVVNSASKCQSNLPDKLLEAVFSISTTLGIAWFSNKIDHDQQCLGETLDDDYDSDGDDDEDGR